MKKFLIITLTVIFCLGCQADLAKEGQVPKMQFGKRFFLPNGLTVIIKESHKQPIASIAAYLKLGSADEGKFAGFGISHFIEHMLFKGTFSRPTGVIEKEIRSFGGDFNGYTSFDYTGFQITILSEFTEKAMEIMADVLENSTFDPSEFAKEKEVILNEIRMNKDDPDRYFSNLIFQKLFTKHTYGLPIIGHKELFEKLTRDDLLEYYKENYSPNNIVLAIAGDVNTELVIAQVNRLFGNFKRGMSPAAQIIQEPIQISSQGYLETRAINLSRLAVCFHSTDIRSSDLYALDCLAAILGEKETSRLNSTLKNKLQLVYSIDASNFTPKYPGAFIITALLDEKNSEKTKSHILGEIEKIKQKAVSKKELSRAKKLITNQYLLDFESVESQARLLASDEAVIGDYKFLDGYVKKISELNSNDIINVARKYLNENNLTIIELHPEKAKKEEPAELALIPRDISSKKIVLPNGLRVILGENRDLEIVGISAVFEGGLRAEGKETNGIFNLMSELLLKGTAGKSAEEIANTIESIGGEISAFSSNNSFGINIKVLSQDLDIAINLLKEILTQSQFPNSEIQKQKYLINAELVAKEEDIFYNAFKLTKETIFLTHPYRFDPLGTKEGIEKVTRKQIVDTYKNFCCANNMVLSIFGDIDIEKTQKKIEKLFLDLKNNPKFAILTQQEEPQTSQRANSKAMQKEQSVIMLGFQGPRISDKDRYPFEVLNAILTGQAGRIYKGIREELGLSYALGSFPVFGKDPGFLIIYVSTTKENIPKIKEILFNELNSLNNGVIADEEIELAKKQLIGDQKSNLQTNMSFSMQTALDELYGLGYENYLNYANNINEVKKGDLIICAKNYLNPQINSLVIVGPEFK